MKFKLNVDETSMVSRIEKRLEELEDKFSTIEERIDNLFVESGQGSTYELSNLYTIDVKPVEGKVRVTYDLSTMGRGDFIAAKIEVFGINVYETKYRIASSNKLKMALDIDVTDFPITFSFEYRELIDGSEVIYRENINITEVVKTIVDSSKVVTPFDNKVVTLKDSLNILKNQVNFLLKKVNN